MTIIQTTLADCRKCGIAFIDRVGKRLCDGCLVDTLTIEEICGPEADTDDLFAGPSRRLTQTARITCRVCERPAEVPILANGKLCDVCRSDVAATSRHIADRLARAEVARNDAGAVYETAWLDADETIQAQFDRILAQRDTLEFPQRLARARSMPDWNAAVALWEARRRMDEAATMLDTLRVWERLARDEIQAARGKE